MNKILSTKEVFALEAKIVAQGTSIEELMRRAGKAVYQTIIEHFKPCRVIVICGPGNNGGDGFVVANLLKKHSWQVSVAFDNSKVEKLSEVARNNKNKWGDKIIEFSDVSFKDNDLIVDALFGIGLHRELTDIYKDVILGANRASLPCVSIDVPSGIDSDTGEVLGAAFKAKYTVTFNYKKPAHVLNEAKSYVGEVIIKDIGLLG